jgi:Rps23 Pro-64 3,4-dihydroxylase Tpa1-like proline 4-hydroxylase
MIRELDWFKIYTEYDAAVPFNHVVIDNFFTPEVADKLSEEFPDYNDPTINNLNNPLENKKSNNHWDRFPSCTYRAFLEFGNEKILKEMKMLSGTDQLALDYGLNGGGWHMHSKGGVSNVHLDYNLHPKTGQQRKLNIIVYLSKDWKKEWGGGLELWSHDYDNNQPKECVKVVDNIFNRAIIFDTTQNSWHGLPKHIDCPEGVVRKSIAAYFIQPAPASSENRVRALFAPRDDQKDDPEIQEFIQKRASVDFSHKNQ